MDGNFRSTGAFARLFAYANPEIDALLQQATAAPERGTLKTIYFRVQELILRDVPRVMTFRPDELWAVQKRVTMPKVVSLADFFGSIPKWKVQ
jgi:ABC-type transport system substrate-binding protein